MENQVEGSGTEAGVNVRSPELLRVKAPTSVALPPPPFLPFGTFSNRFSVEVVAVSAPNDCSTGRPEPVKFEPGVNSLQLLGLELPTVILATSVLFTVDGDVPSPPPRELIDESTSLLWELL
jgi:hypothetical protein